MKHYLVTYESFPIPDPCHPTDTVVIRAYSAEHAVEKFDDDSFDEGWRAVRVTHLKGWETMTSDEKRIARVRAGA